MNATIHERGNGFPSVGDYVSSDGNLYRIISIGAGRIETHQPGQANTMDVTVEPADWDDCDEPDEFDARIVIA